MVIQDLDVQAECEWYTNLVDRCIALLKLMVKPLNSFYTYHYKKRQANSTHNDGNGDTNPYVILSEIFKQIKHHKYAKYQPRKIGQATQKSSGIPELNDAIDKRNGECGKKYQFDHFWGDKQKENKSDSKNNNNIQNLILSHVLTPLFTGIIKRLATKCKRYLKRLHYQMKH
jgi:hypothetical protein